MSFSAADISAQLLAASLVPENLLQARRPDRWIDPNVASLPAAKLVFLDVLRDIDRMRPVVG